jgi:hypothetical protein
MTIKIEQLEKRRRMILSEFEIGQLDNPQTAKSIENALTNIDLELTLPEERK